MTRIFYLLLIVISINCISCDNEIAASQVPSIVENSFESHFSDATDVEWKMIENNYEVSFENDNVDHEAFLDSSGNLQKYKYEIENANLPQQIITFLKSEYPQEKWDDVEQIVEGKSEYYQLEIDGFLSKKKVVIDSHGNLLTNVKYWK